MQTAIYTPPNWIDPLDWSKVFPTPRPIEVDVGCGKGAFLLWAARARPQSNFAGIERLLVRLRKVDRKIQRLGLENARLLRIEAGYFISKIIPADSVSVYHIYFPDPWPKRRHHRRRLFTPALAMELHRTLAYGGAVNIATDHEQYFQEIRKVLEKSGLFDHGPVETLPEEAKTDFEREFVAEGKPIWRGRYLRKG